MVNQGDFNQLAIGFNAAVPSGDSFVHGVVCICFSPASGATNLVMAPEWFDVPSLTAAEGAW